MSHDGSVAFPHSWIQMVNQSWPRDLKQWKPFDLTIEDSAASESPRVGRSVAGEDRQEGSQQLRSALAVWASCRVYVVADSKRWLRTTPKASPTIHQTSVWRPRISSQDAKSPQQDVEDVCASHGRRTWRTGQCEVRKQKIDSLAQRIGAVPIGGPVPSAIQPEVVIVLCPTHLGRSSCQPVHPSD